MSLVRYAMVTTFYPPYNFGGDGIAVQRLARALVRRGHEVTVFHDLDAYRLLADGKPTGEAEPEGLEVKRLRSRLGPLSPILTQQTGRPVVHGKRLRAELGSGRYDVIHYHNISLVGGPGILSAGRGIKVYEAHEHWLVCPTHVLWRHGRETCSGRQCMRCILRQRRPPQAWRATGHLERQLRHVDVFIAKSEFSRRKHREFGFPREMEVLPYFLPTTSELPPETASPHRRPYFLFVGRLERLKGVDDLIPVFSNYDRADLLVAGDGTRGPQLRAMAQNVRNIRFLGRVPTDELARYYRNAIAVIAPSVGFETFGIVLIEAFRRGTPVIARNIGPFPEILNQSQAGLLFDDTQHLIESMDRLQTEPGLRERFASAAKRSFQRHWSEAAVVPRYLTTVRAAAERKGMQELADSIGVESAA